VSIQRSSASEIAHLVAALGADAPASAVGRDTAVARLRVIGARAVPHLLAAWKSSGDARVRTGVLQALEGHDEPRLVSLVLDGLSDPEAAVRQAAANAARWLLDGTRGSDVLDQLTALALDRAEPTGVRVTAIAVLHDLPRRLIAPILARLAADDDAAVRAAAHAEITPDDTPQALLVDAAAGGGPSDPHLVLQALAAAGPAMPLPTLHRLVGALREREQRAGTPAAGREWQMVRGAAHHLLATRGSRVALYDLRETLRAARGPLPGTFSRAVAAIGDGETLDDLAAAFSTAPDAPHGPWALALRDAARGIVQRERLTKRHAALKRLHARWGETATALLG
jgi:hypothetical protein